MNTERLPPGPVRQGGRRSVFRGTTRLGRRDHGLFSSTGPVVVPRRAGDLRRGSDAQTAYGNGGLRPALLRVRVSSGCLWGHVPRLFGCRFSAAPALCVPTRNPRTHPRLRRRMNFIVDYGRSSIMSTSTCRAESRAMSHIRRGRGSGHQTEAHDGLFARAALCEHLTAVILHYAPADREA